MREQIFLVLGEVSWDCPKQFTSQRFVKWGSCDSKCERLNHVINEVQVIEPVKNCGELHKHFLWLNRFAQTFSNLVEFLVVHFSLLIMEPLDQFFHDLSEVILIFSAEHTDQVNLQLSQVSKLKVDVVDLSHVDVSVRVNQVRIKILKNCFVPSDNDLSGVSSILLRKSLLRLIL